MPALNHAIDPTLAALDVLQRYAQDGDVPVIKAFAAATAPTVQQHLEKARVVRDAVK